MTTIAGTLLVALPLLALFVFIARVDGLRTALAVFGLLLGLLTLTGSFALGLALLSQ